VHKSSAYNIDTPLDQLYLLISDLELEVIHNGTSESFIKHELGRGLSPKSISNAIAVVSAVLNRVAKVWLDENGRPWLRQAPSICFHLQAREEARVTAGH
jgi:hypothetical protein